MNFECLSPEELVVISFMLTFILSEDQDADDLNVLGNFIVSLGSLILTWAAQMQLVKSSKEDGKKKDCSFEEIKKQLLILQEKCDKLVKQSKEYSQ